jgi:hypothetical protein
MKYFVNVFLCQVFFVDKSQFVLYSKYNFIVGTIHPGVFKVFHDEYPELAYLKIQIARQVVGGEFAGMNDALKNKHQRILGY